MLTTKCEVRAAIGVVGGCVRVSGKLTIPIGFGLALADISLTSRCRHCISSRELATELFLQAI